MFISEKWFRMENSNKVTQFISKSVKGLHQTLFNDMNGLTKENLVWAPNKDANPIGFIFLHFLRTEDNLVNDIKGEPSIWDSTKFREDLPDFGRSDKFSTEVIKFLSQIPLKEVLLYGHKVVDNTDLFLESLDDVQLRTRPETKGPLRTIETIFRAFILAHGWWHIGEIKYIKGLQGINTA